ncbi:MAG: aldehyde dehydrogenase family protein [Pseudomonadota bacterium]
MHAAPKFPLLIHACKIGPALAAGKSVHVKRAGQTTLAAFCVAELVIEAERCATVTGYFSGSAMTGARPMAPMSRLQSMKMYETLQRRGRRSLAPCSI